MDTKSVKLAMFLSGGFPTKRTAAYLFIDESSDKYISQEVFESIKDFEKQVLMKHLGYIDVINVSFDYYFTAPLLNRIESKLEPRLILSIIPDEKIDETLLDTTVCQGDFGIFHGVQIYSGVGNYKLHALINSVSAVTGYGVTLDVRRSLALVKNGITPRDTHRLAFDHFEENESVDRIDIRVTDVVNGVIEVNFSFESTIVFSYKISFCDFLVRCCNLGKPPTVKTLVNEIVTKEFRNRKTDPMSQLDATAVLNLDIGNTSYKVPVDEALGKFLQDDTNNETSPYNGGYVDETIGLTVSSSRISH